jgi:hypothetical protein
MEYQEAITALLKTEGSQEPIKAIEKQVQELKTEVKNYLVMEANVAKLLGEKNIEGETYTQQLETLLKQNKELVTEKQDLTTTLNGMKQELNSAKLSDKYNVKTLSKLVDLSSLTFKDDGEFVGELKLETYLDNNFPEFKGLIVKEKPKQNQDEDASNPKLTSGSSSQGSKIDPIIKHINNMFAPNILGAK